ncbi:MAG: YkgJ family cysteine cluster protein [Edaphocola sp.]
MDLERFKQVAGGDREDLVVFLRSLDKMLPRGLPRIVAEEDAKVWRQVDCTSCANCCKTMTPVFTKADVKRAATFLRMSPKDFFGKWLEAEEGTGKIINKQTPCQFLQDDKCTIYEVRPRDCAGFPHHNKRPFDLYNETFIQNVLVHDKKYN